MLASMSRNGFASGRGTSLTLFVVAVLVCAVPTFQHGPALAQSDGASAHARKGAKRRAAAKARKSAEPTRELSDREATAQAIREASDMAADPNRLEKMREFADMIDVHRLVDGQPVLAGPITESLHNFVGTVGGDSWDGSLWLWGRTGRPAAVVQMWIRRPVGDLWMFSFTSLSDGSVTAAGHDRLWWMRWMPRTPGLDVKPLDDETRPAKKPATRLKQMRRLAGRFSAHEMWDENRVPLRQLPMPLHRYADPKAGLLDGAMFVWANGSDPEVVLLLEVTGDDLASAKWQYALAATGSAETKVNFDGQQVWHRPRVPDVTGTSTDPYWICGERVVAGDEGPSKPTEGDDGDVDKYPDGEERGYPYPPSGDPYDH